MVIPRPRERTGAGTGKGASRPRTLGGAQVSGRGGGGMYSEYTELTGRGGSLGIWFILGILSLGALAERWAALRVLTGACIGVNLDAEVVWWCWRRYFESGRYGRQV